MKGILRILNHDLTSALHGPRVLLLTLVLPCVLLLVVGQLEIGAPPLRILVAGTEEKASSEPETPLQATLLAFEQISTLVATVLPGIVEDPLAVMSRENYDLILQIHDENDPRTWELLAAETNPQKLAAIRRFLGLGWSTEALRGAANLPPQNRGGENDMEDYGAIYAMSTFTRLKEYYPTAGKLNIRLIPGTIALILCMVPFVLGSIALSRDRDTRMLEVMLSARGIGPLQLFFGKCLLPILVGLCNFGVMVLLAQTVYGLHIKDDILPILLSILPALVVSTSLAMSVSAASQTQAQTTMAAGVYFLALLLLSGFLYPIESSSAAVQVLSHLSPLTHLKPVLETWMFGAPVDAVVPPTAAVLSAQALFYSVCGWWLFVRLRLGI